MAVSTIHTAFSAGEIAPALYGRVDYQKLSIAGTTVRNCFVSYRGGAYSRGGTAYVIRSFTNVTPGVAPPRVITFQFSVTQGIVIEIGGGYMRFFINGAPVFQDPFNISAITQAIPCVVTAPGNDFGGGDWVSIQGVNGMFPLNGRVFEVFPIDANSFQLVNLGGSASYPAYISGGTAARVYTIATPYAAADVAALKFTQSADVMSITHPSYPPYDLARIQDNLWTLTPAPIDADTTPPANISATATVHPNSGTSPPTLPCAYAYVVTAIAPDGLESHASDVANVIDSVDMAVTAGSIVIAWNAATGASRYNVYRAPASYNTDPGNTGQALPVPVGAVFSYIGTTTGTQFVDNNILADTTISPPQHRNPFAPGQVSMITMLATGSGYTVATPSISTVTGTGFVGVCVIVSGGVSAVIVLNAGRDYAVGDSMIITGDGGGANAQLIVGPTTGTYPALVTYYQQRRVYAATNNNPDTYYMSKPGRFTNFDVSFPSSPDDAITGTPWSQQVNGIQWMVQMPGGLVTFTGKGAWQVGGVGGSGFAPAPVTPSSQQAQQVMFNGISPLVGPLAINFDLLYVQSKGAKVLDATYSFFTNNYTGTDQTVLCGHLFLGYDITQWAWCEEPYKIIWAVRCDGVLLSFTFMKEQEVAAWSRHDTQGKFLSVCSVTEPPVDALYCVVLRDTISGLTYFIERMDDRIWQTSEDPWCVDCALEYPQLAPGVSISASSVAGAVTFTASMPAFPGSAIGSVLRVAGGIATISGMDSNQVVHGTWVLSPTQIVPYEFGSLLNRRFLTCGDEWTITQPTSTIYGLDHLAGLSVTGLVDGIVLPPTVVTVEGTVTLPFPASSIKVGLGFTARVQTPYLDVGNPTIQGRRKDFTAVTVRVDASAVPNIGANQPDGGAQVPPSIDPPWVGLTPGVTQNPGQQPATYMGPSGQVTTLLFSGDFRANVFPDWNEKGQVAIEQTQPLPMAITACIPEALEGDVPEQTYSQKAYGHDQQQPAHPRSPGVWMLQR